LILTRRDFPFVTNRPNAVSLCANIIDLRISALFSAQRAGSPCQAYADHAALVQGLGREETAAIRCLAARIEGMVGRLAQTHGLSDAVAQELLSDVVVLMIRKVQQGAYVYIGNDPASYAVEIAKNRAKYYLRQAMRHSTLPLDAVADAGDVTAEEAYDTAPLAELIHQLGESCQRLIRLKYLEEIRDKDVIEHKLTQYTTVDALKSHRSKCLKKLTELAKSFRKHDG
jgi:DNA-directed RNA polymerase specialized sigma24 family protein